MTTDVERANWYGEVMQTHSPTMTWKKASEVNPRHIINRHYYLVITNGWEWRDPFIRAVPGLVVKDALKRALVRGRPEWIAPITNPLPASTTP